jgi:hypothetical protein
MDLLVMVFTGYGKLYRIRGNDQVVAHTNGDRNRYSHRHTRNTTNGDIHSYCAAFPHLVSGGQPLAMSP